MTVVLCNLPLLSDSASFWPSVVVAVMTSFQYLMSQQTERMNGISLTDSNDVCNEDLTLKAPKKNCSRRHFNFLLLSFEDKA